MYVCFWDYVSLLTTQNNPFYLSIVIEMKLTNKSIVTLINDQREKLLYYTQMPKYDVRHGWEIPSKLFICTIVDWIIDF